MIIYPTGQFLTDSFNTPFRLDRNQFGGGLLFYVREGLPSKNLTEYKKLDRDKGMD